ncbi:MAG: glycogen debranching protein [Thermoanaerobaculia bacterium]
MSSLAPAPGVEFAPDRTGFGLASENATRVELALWSPARGPEAAETILLERIAPALWWGEVAGDCAGLRYGYHVDGPQAPERGLRFAPELMLLDPRAPAVAGAPRHQGGGGLQGVVVEAPVLAAEPRPRRPWAETVIYEAHVKGLTKLHPEVAPELRGTYLGLASEPILDHLRRLGVTTVELLPVQHHVTEARLARSGLTNYWGYSPVGFLAPHAGYATGEDGRQVAEFRAMVGRLHAAGFEVVVDLVLNHCGEGAPDEPTLSLRGIDNASYYRLLPDDPTRYLDFTGCGNTLAAAQPLVRQLLLDCLRWWRERLAVDGFRLDLAPTLFRDADGAFDPAAPLFTAIAADPVLAGVKWIVEPWDLGPGGHCLGRFPPGWLEWNDRFRDAVRRFWRGDAGAAPEAARRLTGSPELFPDPARKTAINYLTCHDGFTLRDLVSYSEKRNQANGEGNRDGAAENWSHGWGAEGPTRRTEVLERRRRVREGLLASLLLAPGVPMLAHGDELGRTQGGNNNAYCHDGPLTWIDWRVEREEDFRDLVAALVALRRSHPDLRGPQERPADRPSARSLGPAGLALHLGERLVLLCNPGARPLGVPTALSLARPLLAAGRAWDPNGNRPFDLPAHSWLLLES